MKNVSIIDNNGFCISRTELTDDEGNLLTYKLKNGESVVEKIRDATLLKPNWNGTKWVESATEEEIKAWEDKNKKQEYIITTNDRIDELEASLAELSIALSKKGVI